MSDKNYSEEVGNECCYSEFIEINKELMQQYVLYEVVFNVTQT